MQGYLKHIILNNKKGKKKITCAQINSYQKHMELIINILLSPRQRSCNGI